MSSHARVGGTAPRFSWTPARRPPDAGLVYAEFPLRAAAFVVDLLLGALAATVLATLVASLAFWRSDVDFELLTAVRMLLAALAATLPVAAAAALLWRTSGATPGQRLFGLRVAQRLTGERLPAPAAIARALLLYVPLTLLVALPQLVSVAFDHSPLMILIHLPWLPFATISLPLLWYLALAYPALADRRRVRALHDRVCGSVVVRSVREPTTTGQRPVESIERPLSELVPFSWFARIGLSPWAWLFAAAAIAVAADRIVDMAPWRWQDPELPGFALHHVADTLTVLLPAALLWRVRDATRRHPLLLLGLGLAAAFVVVPTVAGWIARAGPDATAVLSAAPLGWLQASVPVLIGLGLLAMRERGPSRPALLIALAALLIGALLAPTLVGLSAPADVFQIVATATFAVVGAFALWVPLSAWLDGDRPRHFWSLLASAVALQVALAVVSVIVFFGFQDQQPEMQPVVSALAAAAAAGSALLALLAYGIVAPRD